jgi:hypothetical protein
MKELLQSKNVPGLHSYSPDSIRPEVPIQPFLPQGNKRRSGGAGTPGKSRIDFQIKHDDGSNTFVEVKSVTYKQECGSPLLLQLSAFALANSRSLSMCR